MGVQSKGVVFPLKAFNVFLLPMGSNLQKVTYLGGGGHMQYLKIPGLPHLACPTLAAFLLSGLLSGPGGMLCPQLSGPSHPCCPPLPLLRVSLSF